MYRHLLPGRISKLFLPPNRAAQTQYVAGASLLLTRRQEVLRPTPSCDVARAAAEPPTEEAHSHEDGAHAPYAKVVQFQAMGEINLPTQNERRR